MKKFIKDKWLYIVFGLAALICFLLAVFGDYQNIGVFFIINKPLELIALLIRKCYALGGFMIFISYLLFILIGLSILIYPLIKIFKTKKFAPRYLSFLATSIFLLVILYFFINPSKISYVYDEIGTQVPQEILDSIRITKQGITDIVKSGMMVTFLALISLCVLLEISNNLNENQSKVFFWCKVCINCFIAYIIYLVFFDKVYEVKTAINAIPENFNIGMKNIMIDKGLNIFVIIICLLCDVTPYFLVIASLLVGKALLNGLTKDLFAVSNKIKVDNLVTISKNSLLCILTTTIFKNLMLLVFQSKLMNTYYELNIPFALLFSICLVLIVAKILAKAIDVNEENKLVI